MMDEAELRGKTMKQLKSLLWNTNELMNRPKRMLWYVKNELILDAIIISREINRRKEIKRRKRIKRKRKCPGM